MKRILFLVLIAFNGYSQIDLSDAYLITPNPFNVSPLMTSDRDITLSRKGALIYKTSDSAVYVSTGTQWITVSNAGAIAKATIDSTHGWATYNDGVYTSSNKFTIAQGDTSILPNNAATSINSQLPTGVTAFYNGTTNKITPENSGDAYVIRVSFKSSNNNNTGLAALILDIGGPGLILNRTIGFPKGQNTEIAYTTTSLIFSLDTFLANGGSLKVHSVTGITSVWDIQYLISRIHKAK